MELSRVKQSPFLYFELHLYLTFSLPISPWTNLILQDPLFYFYHLFVYFLHFNTSLEFDRKKAKTFFARIASVYETRPQVRGFDKLTRPHSSVNNNWCIFL